MPEQSQPRHSKDEIDKIREEFKSKRGWWADNWEAVLQLDPDYIHGYSQFSEVPVKHGYIDPKVREFIWIAVDASVTHLYLPGLRRHVRNALRLGATREEIMEVIELVSIIGVHAAAVACPILFEEAEIFDTETASGNAPTLDTELKAAGSAHPE